MSLQDNFRYCRAHARHIVLHKIMCKVARIFGISSITCNTNKPMQTRHTTDSTEINASACYIQAGHC